MLLLAAAGAAADPAELAQRHAEQASEAIERSRRAMHAWLRRLDPVTGLLPRRGDDPNWVVKDSAADLYPFLVLASYFTEPDLYEGQMRRVLRQEMLLTTRIASLPDDLQPGGKGFVFPAPELDRIIFGASEYLKDGLVPIAELLGETPWYDRMRSIAGDIVRQAPYISSRGRLPARSAEVNGNMLQALSRLCWRTSDPDYLRQLEAIAAAYLLDILPKTGYLPPDEWDFKRDTPVRPYFHLSDHGNEIIGGLAEACFLALRRDLPQREQWRAAFRPS